jgi:sucrose phosphorylase
MDLLARSGVGRDINRHCYTSEEIDQALARPVVARLLDLIRLRNTHPAFGGKFVLHDAGDNMLQMEWWSDAHFARLRLDFSAGRGRLEYSIESGGTESMELGFSR